MDYLLHHLLRASADRAADREALVFRDERLTFEAAYRHTTGIAGGLRDAGVRRSDRVGILLDPSLELALSIFAIPQAGAAFVPIHHGLFPEQVKHIINDCGMTGLVTSAAHLEQLTPILHECPSLEFVAVTDQAAGAHSGRVMFDLREWSDNPPSGSWQDIGMESDLSAILYTSGSTGKPKGVMLSHANVIAGASIVSEYLSLTDRDRLLAALPFSFDAGLNQLTTAIQQAATCVIVKFVFAREIVAAAEKEQITGLAGVPPLWSLLAQPSSTLHKRDLPHLRYFTNTGGALPLNVLNSLREAVPQAEFFLMYGLTEAFRSTYLPPEELDRRPTSMGKAIPDTEILVVDENGQPCPPGEPGELVHHGPTVSMGYWGRPDLTDKVLRPHPCPPPGLPPSTRVCYSGDLVKRDEDGFLFFVGRRDNLIKSSGFRISPTEVEETLCRSGLVHHAAVVGVPDDVLGQHIHAFVVPPEGVTCDTAELLAYCAQQMPRYMVPKVVEVIDQLPRTSSGKTDYQTLRTRTEQVPATAE